MGYIVYLTTNLITGKIYVGMCSADRHPHYCGGGAKLKEDLRIYGRDNFSRETLHECRTREEAAAIEASIVTDEFRNRADTYNDSTGGTSGFSMSSGTKAVMSDRATDNWTAERKAAASERGKNAPAELRERRAAGLREYYASNPGPNRRRIEIEGLEFPTLRAGASHFDRAEATISRWLRLGLRGARYLDA